MTLEFTKIKYYPLYLFFILTLLISFGSSRGLHLKIAPYFAFISLLIIIATKQNFYKGVLKPLVIFVFLTTISSINYFYFNRVNFTYLEYLSYSNSIYLASFVLFSYINKSPKSIKIIKSLIIAYFLIGFYWYFKSASTLSEKSSVDQLLQNNAFYYVLMPLPLIFLLKSRVAQTIALIITFVICILSTKRSAIIVVSIISLFFIYYNYIRGEKKLKSTLLLVVFLIALINIIDFSLVFERLDFVYQRLENIQEDGGSGRMEVIDRFFKQDYKELLKFPTIFLGKGFQGYNNDYPYLQSSHNDWIEIFYTLGIIGLLNLLYFFSLLLINLKELYINKSPIFVAYLSAVIIFIFYSLIGGSFHFMFLSMMLFYFLGITEAMIRNKINEL